MRVLDALLDEQNRLRRELVAERVKVDVLRDGLSECLAELPDTQQWWPLQELYVLTDPETWDYPAIDDDLVDEDPDASQTLPHVPTCG